jgi:hypothetical protein
VVSRSAEAVATQGPTVNYWFLLSPASSTADTHRRDSRPATASTHGDRSGHAIKSWGPLGGRTTQTFTRTSLTRSIGGATRNAIPWATRCRNRSAKLANPRKGPGCAAPLVPGCDHQFVVDINFGPCPQCTSVDIICVPSSMSDGYQRSGMTISTFRTIPFSRVICLQCGLVREWISDRAHLDLLRKKFGPAR